MYKKVELKDGFVGMENDVSKVWKEKDIVKKVLMQIKVKDILLFMMDLQQQTVNHMLDILRQEL